MTLPPEQSEALLACPFCAGSAWLSAPRFPIAADCDDAQVLCHDCDAAGPSFLCDMDDEDAAMHWPSASVQAAAAWNKRVPARSLALQPGGE